MAQRLVSLRTVIGPIALLGCLIALPVHASSGSSHEPSPLGWTDKAKSGISKGIDKTKEGINKGADKTKEGVNKGADKTKEGVKKGADKTKEGVKKGADEVKDV